MEDDDEDIGDDWGAAFEESGDTMEGGGDDSDDVASQWAQMLDEGDDDSGGSNVDRVLNQDEIDNLLGFSLDDQMGGEQSGIRALINSALVSYERLPMLEIVFDRLVRESTTSLRNFTSDNVEVSLDSITSVRFGDYLNSIPLPAILGVFRAVEWDNLGLFTVDSSLIYSMIDVLLGGGRGNAAVRVEGRPYTTIEMNLIRRMIEIILEDAETAFAPLSPVKFELDRLETNPRFATISRPANAAILVEFRIDMEDRGGKIEMLLPYATIEPIRDLLLQVFMGEKFGRDPIWENHMAGVVHDSDVTVDAVLYEDMISLNKVLNMVPGETLMFDANASQPVKLKCGGIELTTGQMGRQGDFISVKVQQELNKPKMTYTAFEKAALSEHGD